MATCLARIENVRAVQSDVLVSLDLTHFASIALVLTRRAAEYELIPRHNVDDTEKRIVPFLDATAQLGTLYVEGRAGDGGVYLHATLVAPPDTPSPDGSGA